MTEQQQWVEVCGGPPPPLPFRVASPPALRFSRVSRVSRLARTRRRYEVVHLVLNIAARRFLRHDRVMVFFDVDLAGGHPPSRIMLRGSAQGRKVGSRGAVQLPITQMRALSALGVSVVGRRIALVPQGSDLIGRLPSSSAQGETP
jgi:hypothetical protein